MQNLPIELREKILFDYADTDTKKALRQVCVYYREMLPLECAYCILVGMIAWAIYEFLETDAVFVEINDVIIQTEDVEDLKAVIRDALVSGENIIIEFNVRHARVNEFFDMADRCKMLFYDAAYTMGKAFPGSNFSGSLQANEPILLKTVYDFERCFEINVYDSRAGTMWLDQFVLKFE